MKTREEILEEYLNRRNQASADYYTAVGVAEAWRDVELAELEDPLARLLSAARMTADKLVIDHASCYLYLDECSFKDVIATLRAAIEFAEQHRGQAK